MQHNGQKGENSSQSTTAETMMNHGSRSSLPLDDDGFPSFQLLSEAPPEAEHDRSCHHPNIHESDCVEFGFASDFYSCGTDWSCLASSDDKEAKFERDVSKITPDQGAGGCMGSLKQVDLFRMWGFRNPNVSKSPKHSSPSPPKPPLHKPTMSLNPKPIFGKPVNNRTKRKSCSRSDGDGRVAAAPRACPFYKRIPGTPFTVDAFRYGHVEGCSAYFLTHFHYDHYGGLTKGWSNGPIYCTPLTARLVRMCISVNSVYIRPLELDKVHVIDGIKVTLLEANHCPGAALIHFRLPNGQSCLHTGDFRACKAMQAYPLLVNQRVNVLYLDTTYCNPKYKFPSKEDILSFVVRVTANYLKKQPRTLVIVGAYSIGKECVYLAISEALGVKIYANASRRRILQAFGWPSFSKSLCLHGKDTPLHVLPMSSLRFETLKQYLKTYADQYTAVLAFRPTGWTYSKTIGNQLDLIKPNSKDNVTIYGVPYSEHSSFTELQKFVQFLRPEKVIPTVNVGNAAHRDRMQSYFQEWLTGG